MGDETWYDLSLFLKLTFFINIFNITFCIINNKTIKGQGFEDNSNYTLKPNRT